ncbi:membrane associated rhomboid family serine protease [Paenibacillus cellulosilyticus]|uniref:Membrane associated rhomboid family serine protease n=1 Tax=Paenibacillus cellulosilyticus TaxID=375489 RepID=A0A2V2YR70_9BACL|nr:rhomboid family intramembrane serine protease [Paenibacillus cellulosilyticus]PWV99655.1 membrane associated rhomboid family serine protease [Paenibacillus cellulosilyticus]QKS44907.1 rhomboid family intramembrane serine protease [Paenibacillus cellulosilyticus]
MIFFRYESFRAYLRMYPVTAALIAINLVLYGIVELDGGPYESDILLRYGFLQMETDPYVTTEWWRYVTSMFLHASFMHLFFNMTSLLIFAPPLERLLGHVRYFLLYMVAGIVGNLFSAIMHHGNILSVGASGAIYGIDGAFLFFAIFGKHLLDEASRKTVYGIIAIGLLYSFMNTNVNASAHIGGAIAGFILFGLFTWKKLRRR